MLNVLVTGGTGLVGSAINRLSKDYKYNFKFIGSKDYDLTDYSQVFKCFESFKPEYVIHLAACVGGLYKNMSDNVNMYQKNITINSNILKACHLFKVKKCISCLSTCIFPDKTEYPINESMLHNGPPHNSNYGYAYAKRMLEVESRAYQEQHGSNFICIAPTNIYGPNDNFSIKNGHIIPALIHKCFVAKQNKADFIILGTGKALRQFIYVDDLAKLIIWSLENYNDKELLILSPDESYEISIKNIVELICKYMKYEQISYDNSYSDGQLKKTVSNKKLIDLYGNYTYTSIENGIQNTVKWFEENYNKLRK